MSGHTDETFCCLTTYDRRNNVAKSTTASVVKKLVAYCSHNDIVASVDKMHNITLLHTTDVQVKGLMLLVLDLLTITLWLGDAANECIRFESGDIVMISQNWYLCVIKNSE